MMETVKMSEELTQITLTSKMKKQCKCSKMFILVQSLFLIVHGIFWLFIFPVIFKEILEAKMTIKPGTVAYDAWKSPNIPTKIR